MNMPIEVLLIIILVLLMYIRTSFLQSLVRNPLAKLFLLSFVVMISHRFGVNAGILSSLILILMFHNVFEGMENNEEKNQEKNQENNGEKNQENNEDSQNTSEQVDAESDEKNTTLTNLETMETTTPSNKINTIDLINNDHSDLRNKDKHNISNPNAAGAGIVEEGFQGMSFSKGGFAPY